MISGEAVDCRQMSVVAKFGTSVQMLLLSLLYMRNNGERDLCENCGRTGVQVRPTTRSYGRGATLLVIEKVPVISCPHCGASYLTAKTLHEIARIKLHRRSMSKRRNVAVAEFVSPQQTGYKRLKRTAE